MNPSQATIAQKPRIVPIIPAQPVFPSRTSKLSLLKGLNPEQKLPQARIADVQMNTPLEKLCSIFEQSFAVYAEAYKSRDSWSTKTMFWMRSELEKVKYSPQDVTAFSVLLGEFEERENFSEIASLFLSELTTKEHNKVKENTIITRHLSQPLWNIGNQLHKNRLSVEGDVGDHSGCSCGTDWILHVKGNAGEDVIPSGYRSTIIIEGNAGEYTQLWGHMGTVIVNGNLPPAPEGSQLKVYFSDFTYGFLLKFDSKLEQLMYNSRVFILRLIEWAHRDSRLYHKDKLVMHNGLHGIPLYVRHPIKALLGKLEMW